MRLPHLSHEARTAYAFLLPNFLGFLLFTSLPVLASLGLSFMEWDILTPPRFIGLDNFVRLLGFHTAQGRWVPNDPQFWYYVWNTIYLLVGIPIGIFGSLGLAIVMNQKIPGMVFFRTIFFLPTICSGVAVFLLWKWLYNPDFGLINTGIARFGDLIGVPLKGPNWLSSVAWAKLALVLMNFWIGLGGYNAVLYLAALQEIPQQLYEAAQIDGANAWQRFWTVTWPMISPTTFFIAIMGVIIGFQGGFMAAYVMTGGGPAGSTTTIEYYIYNNAYRWFQMGYAASIAWVLFIVVFVITLINWRYGGRSVHY